MTTTILQPSPLMDKLMADSPSFIKAKPGELIEGIVVFKGKNKLLLDINGVTTGIITGRELRDSFNTFKQLKPGDTVLAMVLEEENDEGMIVLSLRMASQQKAWDHFHQLIENGETMEFVAQEANKGGLIANIDGIRAFLPVSQLAPVNYPRVNNADTSEILSRLQKFLGHRFLVKVITMDEEAGKIVVSEREAMSEERAKSLENLKIGDIKEGLISGVVKFGFFVAFDGLEGLVHISEIAWGHVKNPVEYAKIGDKMTVKIIGIDGDKLSLSVKQLTKDPWEEIATRYPIGKKVQGSVVRFADYGAFLKLEKDINGLVHLSEISHRTVKDPAEVLKIGQKVDAQVISIDIDERRIGLSIKALLPIDKETLELIKKEKEAMEKEAKEKEAQAKAKKEEIIEESSSESSEGKTTDSKGETTEAATHPPKKPKEKNSAVNSPDTKSKTEEKPFVASKTGKKFYPADSVQGKKIKAENKLYFATEEQAKAAGYSD